MSYQVLARKWRPQDFQHMVGQAHVLRALINALEENRLHHAYLFTGTRGVGKTTLARIFAKCLNCETGVTATPCGKCRSCREIAEGRHVDLLEVDAASRTKVEDTRELLDNVQYAPTRGRFKIYLIDEVHMLSGHSFNALLKTLEEPPAHVKFLFATTDPQKLPVTVLSRCLQFSLKRMPLEMISNHLAYVLQQENIPYTDTALRLLARAADGSMRDALSLTDQAIVVGGGQVEETNVQEMLGLLPHDYLVGLLQAVAYNDGQRLLAIIEQMAQLTTDFLIAADSIIALLHSVAVEQIVANPEAAAEVTALAKLLSAADVQLYYQMALHGRRDLPLAPDPRSGFEMMLLRMLAFRIVDDKAQPSSEEEKKKTLIAEPVTPKPQPSVKPAEPVVSTVAVAQPKQPTQPPLTANTPKTPSVPIVQTVPTYEDIPPWLSVEQGSDTEFEVPPWLDAVNKPKVPIAPVALAKSNVITAALTESKLEPIAKPVENQALSPILASSNEWHEIWPKLNLTGMALPLAQHCLLEQVTAEQVTLGLDVSGASLQMAMAEEQLTKALRLYFARPLQLHIVVRELTEETPEKRAKREATEFQAQAEQAILTDPFVQSLQQEFGGVIVPGSIRPRTDKAKM